MYVAVLIFPHSSEEFFAEKREKFVGIKTRFGTIIMCVGGEKVSQGGILMNQM
jgi:hypothetical protein